MEKEKFLKEFVHTFYRKSKKYRRSSKNVAYDIVHIINNISKRFFDNNLVFVENEIFNAFEQNNFTFKTSDKEELTYQNLFSGAHLSNMLFINIDTQCNSDLRLIICKSYPLNSSDDTINRLNHLKCTMNKFWMENKIEGLTKV